MLVTIKSIKEKISALKNLSTIVTDNIKPDILSLAKKYESCLNEATAAGFSDDDTIFMPNAETGITASSDGDTPRRIRLIPPTANVQYRGCTIKRGHRYGTYVITDGKISLTLTPSTPQSTRDFHANLFSEGFVDSDGNILKEIEGSASLLATVISGSNINGRPIVELIAW